MGIGIIATVIQYIHTFATKSPKIPLRAHSKYHGEVVWFRDLAASSPLKGRVSSVMKAGPGVIKQQRAVPRIKLRDAIRALGPGNELREKSQCGSGLVYASGMTDL